MNSKDNLFSKSKLWKEGRTTPADQLHTRDMITVEESFVMHTLK